MASFGEKPTVVIAGGPLIPLAASVTALAPLGALRTERVSGRGGR
jgi:hypothetical protein